MKDWLNYFPKKFLQCQKIFQAFLHSRGGLVPARLLADHMGIDTILVDKNKIPTDSLFVDDIYDSGSTFKKIIPKVTDPSNFVYAILFTRQGKKYPKQPVYAQKTKGAEYIVYPWISWNIGDSKILHYNFWNH